MSTTPISLPNGITAYDPNAAVNAAIAATSNSLGTTAQATQDNFMKMLMAQIKNQDPLSPQDPAQMTSQLTQLNMASGIERLNSSISSMLTQATSQSFLNNASLIGDTVLAPGNSVALDATSSPTFGIQLGAASTQTTVSIVDSNGRTVDELSLGALSQGLHTFNWDGKGYAGNRLASGVYKLLMKASDGAGAAVTSTALTAGVVGGISRPSAGNVPQLLTTDGRTINLADVAQLTKP